MSTVHELLLIKKDHGYRVYLRTGHEHRYYFSRRKKSQAIETFKKQLECTPEYWTLLYNRLQPRLLPDPPYQIIKSRYMSFPTEKTNDSAQLST